MPKKPTSFRVNPLDVNIAKIQYNITNRCEQEVPQDGDFQPVVEKFISNDPTINLSEISVVCKIDKNNPGEKKQNRLLFASFINKNQEKQAIILSKGTKEDLLGYLKKTELFEVCKQKALEM